MAYYMDCIFKSYLFWIVVMVLSFLLLIFISSIIKRYVDDVYKLVLLIYAIYFPIGAFMGGYYLITNKQWVSRGNLFTISFLYTTFMTAILIPGKFLSSYVIRNEYKIRPSIKKSFWGYQYTREYIESREEDMTFIVLYSNIFISIYTLIGFYKLLMEWINLYLL